MAPRTFITGIAGTELSPDERNFIRDADPWGLILFKRNIRDQRQVTELTESFRNTVARQAPVLVDQEGGRVQRLGPPHWPVYPPGQALDRLYERDQAVALAAARLCGRLLASDLLPLGIDVDCLPVADVPAPDADPVIGDRAYGDRPDKVAAIGGAVARGLANGGVLPVLKHLPGHGRASADSHHSLPEVDVDRATLETTDFAAFRLLARLPLGMSAHVVYSAIDPTQPATTSATMVREVIRGFIGFQGLLMSDDVAMNALSGTIGERSGAAIAAGCDIVLHCNGKLDEMREVAANTPRLGGEAAKRADAALAARETPGEFDAVAGRRVFEEMLAPVWRPGEVVAA